MSRLFVLAGVAGVRGVVAPSVDAQMRGNPDHADRAEQRERPGKSMRRMTRLFEQADADRDGRLTQEEIDLHEAARFAQIDTDGDGMVDADEMADLALQRRTQRRIARLDLNEDGALQPNEIEGREMRIGRFDLDGDGSVTRTEMRRAMETGQRAAMRRRGRRGDAEAEQ
ncbi:MAG: EF-hand domain-containing protein [Pseudomonadota bacterium]